MRHPWRFTLIIVAAVAVIAVVGVFVAVSSRVSFSSETARARMVAILESQLDSEVELQDLRLKVLPRLRAEGHGSRFDTKDGATCHL